MYGKNEIVKYMKQLIESPKELTYSKTYGFTRKDVEEYRKHITGKWDIRETSTHWILRRRVSKFGSRASK